MFVIDKKKYEFMRDAYELKKLFGCFYISRLFSKKHYKVLSHIWVILIFKINNEEVIK